MLPGNLLNNWIIDIWILTTANHALQQCITYFIYLWRNFSKTIVHSHRAQETVQLLSRQTLDFISPLLWPTKSPDYVVWGNMQELFIKAIFSLPVEGVCWRIENLNQYIYLLMTKLLDSVDIDCMHAEDILSLLMVINTGRFQSTHNMSLSIITVIGQLADLFC